jgi:hypothetical protein
MLQGLSMCDTKERIHGECYASSVQATLAHGTCHQWCSLAHWMMGTLVVCLTHAWMLPLLPRFGRQTTAARSVPGGVLVEMSWGAPMAGEHTPLYQLTGCITLVLTVGVRVWVWVLWDLRSLQGDQGAEAWVWDKHT